ACSQGQTRGNKSQPKNSVDHSDDNNELLKEAYKLSFEGNYPAAVFLFKSIISGYSEADFVKQAKLGMADSYISKGGYESRLEADLIFSEWLKDYSDQPLAEEVEYRRIQNAIELAKYPGRDGWPELRPERLLKEYLKNHPNSIHRFEAQADLKEIQGRLATGDLNVALFYMNNRQAWAGAEGRLKEVLERYPDFADIDRVLFLLGKVEMERDDSEQAAQCLRQLIKKYPNSLYRTGACDQLAVMGQFDECKE